MAFGGATLLIAVLAGVGGFVPWIRANLTVVVAGVFLYLPAWLIDRREEDTAEHGLTLRPLGRNALLFLLVSVVVFPPYMAGFHVWQTELFEGRFAPSADSYRRFTPVGGSVLTGSATLEGRPEGPADPEQIRVWTDGDRQVVEWGDLDGRRQYSLTSDGKTVVRRIGPKAGWKPHTPTGGSFVIEVDAPMTLVVGGPQTPAGDGRLEAERSTSWIFWLVITQLLLVAIPEEFFYRAYLQGALARAWPSAQRKILGVTTESRFSRRDERPVRPRPLRRGVRSTASCGLLSVAVVRLDEGRHRLDRGRGGLPRRLQYPGRPADQGLSALGACH